MNSRLTLLAVMGMAVVAAAEPAAKTLCRELEQHLQTLKSLEIRYKASGSGIGEETAQGRLIWVKPDRFLHETPNWTVCETGDEQWRYLKDQNTLIRERAPEQSEWRPGDILFYAASRFRPETLEHREDGTRVVGVRSMDESAPGEGIIEFPAEGIQPLALSIRPPEGGDVHYVIVEWTENGKPEATLFEPPDVPPENLIDFRAAGSKR
ncbi:hypothetical protein KKH27_09165 [bacterium]|nr:hypothetical protein [bacterium]MBU1984723.1 hypothetical protein [bacterium]